MPNQYGEMTNLVREIKANQRRSAVQGQRGRNVVVETNLSVVKPVQFNTALPVNEKCAFEDPR